jgi:hypothetical protein
MSGKTKSQVGHVKWLRLNGSIISCLAMNHTNHNPQAHYGNNGMRGKAHNLSLEISHWKVSIDYQKVNFESMCSPLDYKQMVHTLVIPLPPKNKWQPNQHVNKQQMQPNKHKWSCTIDGTQISTFMILAQESWHEFKSSAFVGGMAFHHL